MTYLDCFGLKEPPFSKEIADADLWLPTSKQAVADGLLEALTERASVVLVGEPGVGKTCVLRAIRHRVAAAGYRLTYSHNATLGRRDFYRQLCLALGLAPTATAGNFFYAGRNQGSCRVNRHAAGRSVVVAACSSFGLRATVLGRSQGRVCRDQRSGWRRRAHS